MITIFFLVFSFVALVGMTAKLIQITRSVSAPKARPVLASPTKGLSHVAKVLVEEYNALPADSRPYPDIIPIVRAMDVIYEDSAKERDNHFNDNWLYFIGEHSVRKEYRFRWKASGAGPCLHTSGGALGKCPFRKYIELHNLIQGVADGIRAKERALRLSENAGDIESLEELMKMLRDEATLQKSMAQKFKNMG